jgi:ubiquinone/menaquinone biosynthesis C-methylase UbiE
MTLPAYRDQNMQYWTKRAPSYGDVNREELSTAQHDVWRQTLLRRIQTAFQNREPKTIRILDVGTGPGFFAILLAEAGFSVTAVDYTEAMLEEARRNAASQGFSIRFLLADAEALPFEDGTFDVVVTRNLTWNLPHPDRAYREWVRVLKGEGLLLNFDANWYRYLYHADALKAHLTDRENVEKTHAADDTAGTDVAAMEAIAKKAPLSQTLRPAWDLTLLSSLGMDANADETIWWQVWTKEEWINNASTPLFLVYATKPSGRPAERV